MKVAALQAWFGQDKELAATRQRILANVEGIEVVGAAERAAKVCSLLPSTGKVELDAALALGRTAVDLGKDNEFLAWFLLALGMAEYRGGHFAAAMRPRSSPRWTAQKALTATASWHTS